MKKIGVIIKHPFRDFDWRIDIYEVKEDMTDKEIHEYVMSNMLDPFEIIAITERLFFGNAIK